MQNQHHMMCRAKFPELESLVHHPIDYARVVKAIGNEMDITLIDTLEDILPQVRQSLLSSMIVLELNAIGPKVLLQDVAAACSETLNADSSQASDPVLLTRSGKPFACRQLLWWCL